VKQQHTRQQQTYTHDSYTKNNTQHHTTTKIEEDLSHK
jgi:hypothetical protein